MWSTWICTIPPAIEINAIVESKLEILLAIGCSFQRSYYVGEEVLVLLSFPRTCAVTRDKDASLELSVSRELIGINILLAFILIQRPDNVLDVFFCKSGTFSDRKCYDEALRLCKRNCIPSIFIYCFEACNSCFCFVLNIFFSFFCF